MYGFEGSSNSLYERMLRNMKNGYTAVQFLQPMTEAKQRQILSRMLKAVSQVFLACPSHLLAVSTTESTFITQKKYSPTENLNR
jgi:regulator of sirC expression with transglutaminase-like and TPR domain